MQPNLKAKGRFSRIKRNWELYLFMLPAIVYIAIFHYGPLSGVQIAFRDFNPAFEISQSRWVGFLHFQNFFNGFYFKRLIINTLLLSTYSIVLGFPIPILVALMLNEIRSAKYKKLVQTVLYAPHFISTVVMVGIIQTMLSPSIGVINHLLETLGFERQYFMIQPGAFRTVYVLSGIWQNMGWNAVIYLAALSAVDPELHEAATIDGASRLKRVRYINIPTILPTIIIMLIMRIGNLASIGYEKIYLLQNDLNLETAEVISTYVYRRGLGGGQYSFSTAVGLFNNVINVVLLIFANTIARNTGETSLF